MGLLSGSFVVVVAAAALAWACVPQPRLITIDPSPFGPPGTKVTINALGFDPGRAEIRWNSADGDLLGSAEGPDFSLAVSVPRVADGLYHVIVLARLPSGGIGNTAAVAFQVRSGRDISPASLPTALRTDKDTDRSVGPSWMAVALLAASAVGLVGLGCAGGILLSRRRRGTAVSHRIERDSDLGP